MKYKKEVTGVAVGLVANKLTEVSTAKLWAKLSDEAVEKRKAVYDQARKEGKSEEEASAIAFKASPLWNKIGSRRLNGAAVALIGLGAMQLGQKELGKGIAAAGLAKVLIPGRWLDLEFTEK
jgi:hypothetical protein